MYLDQWDPHKTAEKLYDMSPERILHTVKRHFGFNYLPAAIYLHLFE